MPHGQDNHCFIDEIPKASKTIQDPLDQEKLGSKTLLSL